MITAADRFYYEWTYRVVLPSITRFVRVLPTSCVRRLADRADRREAAATYTREGTRVGVLRRKAVDRFDARSGAAVTYYFELRRRSEGS